MRKRHDATLTALVPKDALRRAYRRRPTHLWKLLSLWFVLLSLGAIGVALSESSYGLVACMLAGIAAGNVVRGLGSITHDAAHGTVARHPTLLYLIGCLSWLPSLMSFTLYRSYHLDHHRIVNMPHDTDRVQTSQLTSVRTLARLLRMLIFTCAYPIYWALRVGRHYRVLTPGRKARVWAELAVAYGILLGLLPLMSLPVWLSFFGSMVGTGFVLASLTTMAEHYDIDFHPDPAFSSRTYGTESRFIDWIWGSSTFHIEHHGFPGIPYYNLRAFHREVLPHYPPALRRNVHPELWSLLISLLRRLWVMTDEEEQARRERDLADIARLSRLDDFVSRRGLPQEMTGKGTRG